MKPIDKANSIKIEIKLSIYDTFTYNTLLKFLLKGMKQ